MGGSLIANIESTLKNLIENIGPSGGYHYDWNNVSFGVVSPEETAFSAAPAFPSAHIVLIEEKNIDEPDTENAAGPSGAFSGAYYNVMTYMISIGGNSSVSPPDRRAGLLNALDDLKKLFGVNYTLKNSGASAVMYKGFEFANGASLTIDSYWTIRYYQSRTEPDKVAEA